MNVEDNSTCASATTDKMRAPGKFPNFGEFTRNSKAYASLPNRSSGLWTDEDDVPAAVVTTTTTTSADTTAAMMLSGNQARSTDSDSSLASDVVGHSFGLSSNLSSESLKNACDFYDDELSDDDFIEVQSTPQSFNQHKSKSKRPSHPISCAMSVTSGNQHNNNKNIDQNPLWSADGSDQTSGVENDCSASRSTPDDALSVLNELDAILDKHGASQLNISGLSSCNGDGEKVEDYLMDLDNYLEELDNECVLHDTEDLTPFDVVGQPGQLQRNARTRTLPISKKRRQIKSALEAKELETVDDMEFKNGQDLRKTISCALHNHNEATESTATTPRIHDGIADDWPHCSLRQSTPLAQDNDINAKATVSPSTTQEDVLSNASSSTAHINEGDPNVMLGIPTLLEAGEMRRCFSQGNFAATAQAPATSGHNIEMLTDEHIFDSLLHSESLCQSDDNRPRQLGRRAEGHPRLMAVRSEQPGCTILSHHDRRPMSAPAQTAGYTQTERADESCSDMSSGRCSRIPSPVSVAVSCSDSSSTGTENIETNMALNDNQASGNTQALDPDAARIREKCGFNSEWPHGCSRTLAYIGCTLGLFNICRFAVLTMNYGGNFLLQFLLLSIVFGIPLFWLQMCLGAKIKAGPVSMWKISPICSGIGIALVMVQCFIAIYSTVSVAWVLIYLRDSFPNNGRALYRWQETAYPYRFAVDNSTGNLTDTVADYFNIVVLQRLQFARRSDGTSVRFHVNDRLAFYLALIWATVFLILCKGLKSLGKLVYIIYTLPLIALIVIAGKFIYVVDPARLQNIFSASDLDEFLVNSKTWTAATQETFLTWGLLGASVIAISSRSCARSNKFSLRRDAILIVLVTLLGLCASALLALCCAQILRKNGYIYAPGSFENPDSYTAVYSLKAPINTELISYPHNLVPHYSSFVGETYHRPNSVIHRDSGYQALRFITELFPAVLSLTSDSVSWVWAAVAFSMFASFGLAQLCAMWKPISSALGNSTSSVLLSCVTGLLLSIPFATEMGISILYYMDFLLGAAWFVPVLWTAQIFGVFLIRGRPYNGDDLVNDLRMSASMSAFLALSWNVLLPIGLVTLSVVDYKTSLSNQFYYWRGKSYFSYWTRKVGSLIQIGLLLVVPITAIIQIYRYLTSGPPDILERIQLLYRPSEESGDQRRAGGRNRDNMARRNVNANGAVSNELSGQERQNDAPPKYTPPPSYTTATGARLAKLLRQSIRRSVRRVLGESSRTRPTLTIDAEANNQQAPPPDYLTILTNPARQNSQTTESQRQLTVSSEAIEIDQRPVLNPYAQRSLTLGRKLMQQKQRRFDEQNRPASARANLEFGSSLQRPYTAEDVVTILRSSVRNRQTRAVGATPAMAPHIENTFRSIENLVLNAEPPDQTPGVGTAADSDSIVELNNTSVI